MSRHVLLVEDDRTARNSLASFLKELGYDVCAVWSAEDAKAALGSFSPDVALLDVRLPGMPGDAFAVYLRHKFPSIKIVFVSGEFRLDDLGRFGPAVDVLSKPLDFTKLLHAIQD